MTVLVRKVTTADFDLESAKWQTVSDEAKDLVRALI